MLEFHSLGERRRRNGWNAFLPPLPRRQEGRGGRRKVIESLARVERERGSKYLQNRLKTIRPTDDSPRRRQTNSEAKAGSGNCASVVHTCRLFRANVLEPASCLRVRALADTRVNVGQTLTDVLGCLGRHKGKCHTCGAYAVDGYGRSFSDSSATLTSFPHWTLGFLFLLLCSDLTHFNTLAHFPSSTPSPAFRACGTNGAQSFKRHRSQVSSQLHVWHEIVQNLATRDKRLLFGQLYILSFNCFNY